MPASPTVSPTEQSLTSTRYVASAVCVIPTSDPDLWGVFVGFHAARRLLGIMTTEEMLAHFRQSWLYEVENYNTNQAAELRVVPKVSSVELDDILADLSL